MGKKITEMTDEEITAEIARLEETHIPSAPAAKRPRRLDQEPRKRKSLLDLVEEG